MRRERRRFGPESDCLLSPRAAGRGVCCSCRHPVLQALPSAAPLPQQLAVSDYRFCTLCVPEARRLAGRWAARAGPLGGQWNGAGPTPSPPQGRQPGWSEPCLQQRRIVGSSRPAQCVARLLFVDVDFRGGVQRFLVRVGKNVKVLLHSTVPVAWVKVPLGPQPVVRR